MFLSYEYIGYIGYDKETNQHKYRYKIIDSEFEEVVVVVGHGVEIAGSRAVIDTYEKRNLPVALNLIKAMLYIVKKYGCPISQVIEWTKKHNKFKKYEQDINKYLILI